MAQVSSARSALAGVVIGAAVVAGPQASHRGSAQSLEDIGRQLTVIAIEDGRNPTAAEWTLLAGILRGDGRSGVPPTPARRMAVRAMGRLERREAVPVLLSLLGDRYLSADAAISLMLVLRANLPAAPDDAQLRDALDTVRQQTSSPAALGHLPYTSPDQVESAETQLRRWLETYTPPRSADARALEALARLNRKLWQLTEETRAALRKLATRDDARLPFDDDVTPRDAMAALMSAGAADGELIAEVLGDRAPEVRRLAALALFSGGAQIDPGRRAELIRQALRDSSALVRYEGVRAWARREAAANGCDPLLAALRDESMHVALAAIDALGERCAASDEATDAVAGEVRTPSSVGEWQRAAHALIALAKRSPDRAALAMSTFRQHPVWQVRMYTARAAALLKDANTLERLAYDDHDNVREAALPPLRLLRRAEGDKALRAALGRTDYQLLRTAAIVLRDAEPSKDLLLGLVSALERVTAEKKETSRDTRLALIERIRALAGREQYSVFERLLRDFDPKVAAAAAAACSDLSGKVVPPDPQLLPRPAGPSQAEITRRIAARIEVDSGRSFDILLDQMLAPLAASRFARLAEAHYYDGLTFHRVAPNFVVQGGSPGANEYAGEPRFWRDELGGANERGAVGISTRGRDTGDGQFYINLVDNPPLDFEYSVFGRVRAQDLPIVDTIVEGTKILRINFVRQR
jgi:cyclophilin family peptidyl-prolyl cis-trans isomerase